MAEVPPHPRHPLLFLDYDGTLAPIVDDPSQAGPYPAVPVLLPALAAHHPLWIVTGRDLAALTALLPDLALNAVGLHGAEEGRLGGRVSRAVLEQHSETLARMRARVPEIAGVMVEEKSGAFAVHYRRAEDEAEARRALERWTAGVPDGLVPIWGKHVVELRAQGVSKGTAVARLAADHPTRTPVYLGDDVTDEDAFRALHEIDPGAVTVHVGSRDTAARYRLDDVEAVVEYLRGFLPSGTT